MRGKTPNKLANKTFKHKKAGKGGRVKENKVGCGEKVVHPPRMVKPITPSSNKGKLGGS